mmetsp:Transcript_33738/g.47958  ORF Transcript_33738/g.47958 Transcript_33738/m.47958 type:complete len:400 (+) Transcript_33738:66-1265(+)|eukprot:CAMPEP_0202446014 /NCGR_PEP_ID=MMETSP1360-20130828/4672_1 /ASSEMBLY_ACC=CAM_ASM_000848 /TAXON_ID=515479 /ORGANISM="Licmophora paradoxa, Strain CCMP2313" /LENGTH=399 /DNA_ID=CAMNT_0049062431 /DNA_START=68 /DNA_END=1267 /DNA_ORIENTATION=-
MNPNEHRKEEEEEEENKISFSGMPDFSGGISINVDEEEVGEETTRRIGGSGFAPSFEPVSFADPQAFNMGPSIDTAPVKAMVQTAPSLARNGWNLHSAPILPEFHPLERSAVFVPYITATDVANRVGAVLRDRSIEAHFDNHKAKATCRSIQNVDFRVFLYRGQNTFSHGIIVEVQRRYGASVHFYKDQQAILDAAQGKPVENEDAMATAEIPLVSDNEDEEDNEASSLATLDFAKRLLSFQSYDSNLLAIQTLSSLTDPAKMGVKTSRAVSNHLLASPDNEVGSKVFALIVDQHDLENELRPIAMTVLANALHYSSRDSIHPVLREVIRPVLLKELGGAEKNPQMSFLAARCLEPLVKDDHNVGDLYNALDQAQAVGEARHAGLRDQCQKCIRLIDER